MLQKTMVSRYQRIRELIINLFKIAITAIPFFYKAIKYYCKFLSREVNISELYHYLLPELDRNKISKSKNCMDFLRRKVKVVKKYYSVIKGSCSKVYLLLLDKIIR